METNPVTRFQIQNEGYPERCEVCHQADRFNPKTGICERCTEAAQRLPILKKPGEELEFQKLDMPLVVRTQLKNQLEPNEQILWLDTPVSRKVQNIFIVAFVLLFWVVAFYIGYRIGSGPAWFTQMALYFCFMSYLVTRYIKSLPDFYVLTNKRAIIVHNWREPVFHSCLPRQVSTYRRVNHFDGTTDFIFETSLASGEPHPIGFLQVKDPKTIEALIRETFPT